MLNLIEEFISVQESEILFPGQPINIKMESILNDSMLFSLEADDKKVWSIPSQGFLEILIQSSEMFFVRMNHILLIKDYYSAELEQIKRSKFI